MKAHRALLWNARVRVSRDNTSFPLSRRAASVSKREGDGVEVEHTGGCTYSRLHD